MQQDGTELVDCTINTAGPGWGWFEPTGVYFTVLLAS